MTNRDDTQPIPRVRRPRGAPNRPDDTTIDPFADYREPVNGESAIRSFFKRHKVGITLTAAVGLAATLVVGTTALFSNNDKGKWPRVALPPMPPTSTSSPVVPGPLPTITFEPAPTRPRTPTPTPTASATPTPTPTPQTTEPTPTPTPTTEARRTLRSSPETTSETNTPEPPRRTLEGGSWGDSDSGGFGGPWG